MKIIISICSILFVCLQSVALADTVFLKNGKELKGIVVEEYIDRIKLSTADGEIEILKSDMKDILYDLRVQNLIKLGDFHKEKGNLARAYSYYRKAYKADPSFEPAVTRYLQITSMLLKRPHEQLEKKIEKQKALLRVSRELAEIKKDVSTASMEKLKKLVGIQLISKEEKPYVSKVSSASPAYQSGIKEGDYIIAVWNRLTGYMELEDVRDIILGTKAGELKLTIERIVKLIKGDNIKYAKGGIASLGLYLDMTKRGLTIARILENSLAKNYGLLKSDVISRIADKPTRYMPLREAISLIESLYKEVTITIQRDVTIWISRG